MIGTPIVITIFIGRCLKDLPFLVNLFVLKYIAGISISIPTKRAIRIPIVNRAISFTYTSIRHNGFYDMVGDPKGAGYTQLVLKFNC